MFVTDAGDGGIDTWYCGCANSGTAGATFARLADPGEPGARANATAVMASAASANRGCMRFPSSEFRC
jgi:hypothetical protein